MKTFHFIMYMISFFIALTSLVVFVLSVVMAFQGSPNGLLAVISFVCFIFFGLNAILILSSKTE